MACSSALRFRQRLGWTWVFGVGALLLAATWPEAAHAQIAAHQVTVFKSGSGSGTVTSTGLNPTQIDCGVTCNAFGPEGAEVALTAVADAGSTFIGWVGTGCSGTAACSFTLNQPSTVVAMFGSGAGGFSAADLAGTWYLSTLTDYLGNNSPGWAAMTLVLDGTGTFESGEYFPSYGDGGSFSAATILVDPGTALVSAELFLDGGGSIVIPYARLDRTKTFLSSVVSADPGGRGLTVGIKGGGTFIQADLAGTWYFATLTDYVTGNNPRWTAATVTFDGDGVFASGVLTTSEGASAAIDDSDLLVGEEGRVFGSFYVGEDTVDLYDGKLNSTKTILAAVSSEGDGRGLSVGVKGGGTFSTADLAGTWYFATLTDYLTGNSPGWTAARITLDASGNLVEGFFQPSDEGPGVAASATFTIDANGLVSGTLTSTGGGTVTFANAKMDASKSIMIAPVSETPDSGRGLAVGLKAGTASKVGAFRPSDGTFYLDYNGNGVWDGCGTDRCLSIGLDGDVALVGDWNGTGTSKVGAFRPSDGTFYLDYNGNGVWDGCGTDRCLQIGMNGDIPLVGDWSGSGSSKVGAFRPSDGTFYLDYNGNGTWDGCGTDRCLQIGMNGDIPLVGDWDGTGSAKVGAFRPSDGTFYLDYNGSGTWDGCATDRCLQIGMNGDIPLVGDWDGTGSAKVGAFRPSDGTFYLDYNGNGIWDGCGTDRCTPIGLATDTPIVGDWNGSGTTKVGAFRPSDGTFYLDTNGNGVWEGCAVDTCTPIGLATDTPLVGKW